MKICSIADTHGEHEKVSIEPCDILIVAGDCYSGQDFIDWLSEAPAKVKLFIAGNHDKKLVGLPAMSLPRGNIHYLFDSSYIYNDEGREVKIYGTPWTPKFGNFPFQKYGKDLKEDWAKIPEDTEILITHCPPYEILDQTSAGINIGSPSLNDRIQKLPNLKNHIFGHNHDQPGKLKTAGITYHNASCFNNELFKQIT